MRRPFAHRVLAASAAVVAAAGVWTAVPTGAAVAAGGATAGTTRAACAPVTAPAMRCFARYLVPGATPAAQSSAGARPVTPADLRAAYHLPASAGAGATVAIVDATDDPKAEADLAIFRKRYGLRPCTTANGCFRKVNQNGDRAPLPAGDPGWGLEISLDLDAVSAACPACSILLLEAPPTGAGLGTAVNTAVRMGADVVSNSYGTGTEYTGMVDDGRRWYRHPGTPIVVATGDYGFGPASFPAVLPYVIAVGGTRLVADPATRRGWQETAWRWASSGCSAYIAKPSWQHDGHCLMRTVADVSADAAPATGLLVSDSFGYPGTVQVGGTSLSAPLIAAMIAMAGNATTIRDASGLYRARSGTVNDVVGGSNGFCGHDYLCTGLPGYDAPTGVGTPEGLGAL
jgi:subtilase family serine protease